MIEKDQPHNKNILILGRLAMCRGLTLTPIPYEDPNGF